LGIGAATDPDSATGRFAKPLAWTVAIAIFLFATWFMIVNLAAA